MEHGCDFLHGAEGYVLTLSVAVSVHLAGRFPDSVSKLRYADVLFPAEPAQIISKSILIHLTTSFTKSPGLRNRSVSTISLYQKRRRMSFTICGILSKLITVRGDEAILKRYDSITGRGGNMTDIEMAVVCFINEFHRTNSYRYEDYQMLHGVRYEKEMPRENLEMIRSNYKGSCLQAAYELKTCCIENNLLSNTIVLKMRPERPEIQEMQFIKIHSETDGRDYEYTHHAIEIFKEHGKYKVLDILHRDRAVWLESYLDEVCRTNNCPREQLRYDMGYLAPCHAFAENMQDLSDLMRYLDKVYKVGKPRLSLLNTAETGGKSYMISDDVIMNFDEFGREFGVSRETVIMAFKRVFDRLMGLRFNILHMLCLGHILRDPIMSFVMTEGLFDDEKICEVLDEML